MIDIITCTAPRSDNDYYVNFGILEAMGTPRCVQRVPYVNTYSPLAQISSELRYGIVIHTDNQRSACADTPALREAWTGRTQHKTATGEEIGGRSLAGDPSSIAGFKAWEVSSLGCRGKALYGETGRQ